MNKPLILIGGGGHCKSVIDVAELAGHKIEGIIDRLENAGKTVLGYPVIGTDDDIKKYSATHDFHITIGHIKTNQLRKKLFTAVHEAGGNITSIISPLARVSRHAGIGEGSIIMHYALVNSAVSIGTGCIINSYANIEHDAHIGDFCHISTGAIINGDCRVGNNCFVGSGSTISNGVTICDDCFLSIGTVIAKNIIKSGFYAGNPGKKIK